MTTKNHMEYTNRKKMIGKFNTDFKADGMTLQDLKNKFNNEDYYFSNWATSFGKYGMNGAIIAVVERTTGITVSVFTIESRCTLLFELAL